MTVQLESLMAELREYCQRLSAILPVAVHAALAYSMVRQLAGMKPQCLLSWDHFMELFAKALSDYVEANPDMVSIALWKKEYSKQKNALHEIKRKLNQVLVQDMFR